jgi:DedD protein
MMERDRRSAGWVSTLVALVVLVVVGFLCGALAGFLWEEPGLVLAYLSGKTQPVEWTDADKPADVAAEPPTYSESARPESAELAPTGEPTREAEALDAPTPTPVAVPAAAPAPTPAPAPAKPVEKKLAAPASLAAAKPAPAKPAPVKVAAATPTGRFSVQVGAFADRASADKLVSRLRARGYDTFVKTDTETGGKRFRVRVGPVNARARAEELAAKLAKAEKLPTWILDESKG